MEFQKILRSGTVLAMGAAGVLTLSACEMRPHFWAERFHRFHEAANRTSLMGAPEEGRAVSVHVDFADLNLNSSAGAAALARRIDAAVLQVCGDQNAFDINSQAEVWRCRQDTVAETKPRLIAAVRAAREGRNVAELNRGVDLASVR